MADLKAAKESGTKEGRKEVVRFPGSGPETALRNLG